MCRWREFNAGLAASRTEHVLCYTRGLMHKTGRPPITNQVQLQGSLGATCCEISTALHLTESTERLVLAGSDPRAPSDNISHCACSTAALFTPTEQRFFQTSPFFSLGGDFLSFPFLWALKWCHARRVSTAPNKPVNLSAASRYHTFLLRFILKPANLSHLRFCKWKRHN